MKGLLEVKEFDCITCNDDYKTEYPYLPENVFHELELFIHSFAGDEELSDALDFFSIGYRRNVGETISVKKLCWADSNAKRISGTDITEDLTRRE